MSELKNEDALEQKRKFLEEREKELSEKQRQFELRMKEQQLLFKKDKDALQAANQQRSDELTKREEQLKNEAADLKNQKEKLGQTNSKNAQPEAKVKELQEYIAKIQMELSVKSEQNTELDKRIEQLEDHLRSEHENKPNQGHATVAEYSQLQLFELAGQVNQEMETLQDANQKLKDAVEKLSDLNSNLEVQLQQTMTKNDQQGETIKVSYEQLNQQAEEISELNRKLRDLTLSGDQLAELEKEQVLQNDLNMKEIDQYALKQTQLQDDLQDAQDQLAHFKSRCDEAEGKYADLEPKWKQLKKKFKSLKDEKEKTKLSKRNESNDMFISAATQKDVGTGSQENMSKERAEKQELIQQLQDARNLLKNLQIERNQTESIKQDLMTQHQEQIQSKDQEITQLQEDYKNVVTDKNDFEMICQDLNNQVMKQEEAKTQFDNELQYREGLINDQTNQMANMEMQISQLSLKVKKSELKLRQYTLTKGKDMKRDLKAKEEEINALKVRLLDRVSNSRSSALVAPKKPTKAYERGIGNLRSKSGQHRDYGTYDQASPRNYTSIQEVNEDLEHTGKLNHGDYPGVPRSQTNLDHYYPNDRYESTLPQIKMRPSPGGLRSASSASYLKATPNVPLKYNHQFDAYEMKRRDPSFKNGSSQIAGAFTSSSAAELQRYQSPSKQEQYEILEHKMGKINHVIDGIYSHY